jgi:hypothetical protein
LLVNDEAYEVEYKRRTLGDNIRSGNNIFEIEDDSRLVSKIINYFQEQFISVARNGERSEDINDLEFLLTQCGLDQLFKFLNTIKEEDFGFESNMAYYCKKCKKENSFNIFDPFISCLLISNNLSQDQRAISRIKDLLLMRSYNVLTMEELLKIPLSDFDFWNKKIIEMKNLTNGKIDYFSEANQVREFEEEATIG